MRVILKDNGGNKIVYHFVDSNLGELRYPQKVGLTEKEEESFGSCSAWEGGGGGGGANDLPWGRKRLPGGPGVGENYKG